MLTVSPDSFLAILAEFGPSLLVVAPFLPALILALALLALTARPVPILAVAALRPRRQAGLFHRPELLAAGLVVAVTLTGLAAIRGVGA